MQSVSNVVMISLCPTGVVGKLIFLKRGGSTLPCCRISSLTNTVIWGVGSFYLDQLLEMKMWGEKSWRTVCERAYKVFETDVFTLSLACILCFLWGEFFLMLFLYFKRSTKWPLQWDQQYGWKLQGFRFLSATTEKGETAGVHWIWRFSKE